MPSLYTTFIGFGPSNGEADPEIDDKIISELKLWAEHFEVEKNGAFHCVHLSNEWEESYSLDSLREITEEHPDYGFHLYTDYNSHEQEI